MKSLLASVAALGLLASPTLAAPAPSTNTMAAKATPPKATKMVKVTKSVAKAAKAEGESPATEAKEIAKAKTHHAKAKPHKAKARHAKAKTTAAKAPAKTKA